MKNKLNIGCWKNIKKDFINLDKNDYEGVDVICDIEKEKLPFNNNSFDLILARHILEHISNLDFVMNEIFRVLRKGGRIIIESPHFNSNGVYVDSTHKRGFSVRTFDYYTKISNMDYLGIKKFSSCKCNIIFEKRIGMFWNYFLEPLININKTTQNYYERSPLSLFPSRFIKCEIIK